MARSNFSGAWGHNLQLEVFSAWNTPNIEGNFSVVNVQVRLIANGYAALWGATGKLLSLNVGGIREDARVDMSISQGQVKALWAKDYRVNHNPDGTKSITISATLHADVSNYGSATVSFNLPLSNIPRASTGSSANGTIGQPIALNISRHSGSFKHAIWVRFGNYDKKIAGDNVDTSYTWTPEMSMCNEIPDASTGRGTLTYITYNNGREIGRNTQPVTLSVPDNIKPTLTSLTLTETNGVVKGLLSGNNFLQIMSNIQVTFNGAAGVYGSSIKGYRAEIVNKNLAINSNNGMLGMMDFNGSATIRASVFDSRGRQSDTKDITINVIEYFSPVLSFTAFRTRENPNIIQVVRNAKIAPITLAGKQKNVMSLNFKVSQLGSNQFTNDNGSASGTFTTQSALTNSAANLAGNYRADKSFDVICVLSDKFTSVEFKAPTVTSEDVIIGYDKDGHVGIGKIPELGKAGSLDVKGDIYAGNKPIQQLQLSENNGSAIEVKGDWNDVVKTGFFMGANLKNAPNFKDMSPWVYVKTTRHNDKYILQEAIDFGGVFSAYRVKINNAWHSWHYYAMADNQNLKFRDWTSTGHPTCYYKQQGDIVTLRINAKGPGKGNLTIGTIPKELLPIPGTASMLTVSVWSIEGSEDKHLQINEDGGMHILRADGYDIRTQIQWSI